MDNMTDKVPYFKNGDVKIVLSEHSTDVLRLHSSALAKHSPLFQASLRKAAWTHNKIVTDDDGSYKLLELDFDGGDAFPLLIGRSKETDQTSLALKRESHDRIAEERPRKGLKFFTYTRHQSWAVIEVYKILVVLMHGRRVAVSRRSQRIAAAVIPAVVELADACNMLPAFTGQLNTLIFAQDWSGYESISCNPFHFIRAGYKLEIPEIYKEAMKHAAAIDLAGTSSTGSLGVDFFAALNETNFEFDFEKYRNQFLASVRDLWEMFMLTEPTISVLDVARTIGTAIFRDWAIKNFKRECTVYRAMQLLRSPELNIDLIITSWDCKDWAEITGIAYDKVHSAVKDCFDGARQHLRTIFPDCHMATGYNEKVVSKIVRGSHDEDYYASFDFDDDHIFPWAMIREMYTMDSEFMGYEDDSEGEGEA